MTRHPDRSAMALIALAFVAYISLGLPDGLLGVAWPSVRSDFSLPLDSLGALLIATTIGYLTASFFGGRVLAHLRLGMLLAASSFIAGAALLGYALSPAWWMMVITGVFAGLGGGAIDVALNTYIATYHGERLMQWLHASYGVGATIGPVLMTLAISLLGGWRWGYAIVAVLQFVLVIAFLLTVRLWEIKKNTPPTEEKTVHMSDYNTAMMDTLSRPAVWMSFFLFFIYMGIEFTLGSWAYTLLTESRGVPTRLAGLWMGSYWGIFTAGRILAGLYADRISQRVMIIGGLLAALMASALLAWNPNTFLNLIAVTVIGLAIAPVMPALISSTADRVGIRYTANTIGIQIAAMGFGGAVIPSITGILAQRFSLEVIPAFLIGLIAVLIAVYAFSLREPASQAVSAQV